MEINLTTGLLLVGTVQALFIAVSVFARPQGSSSANRFLALLLLSFALALLTHLLTVTDTWRQWPRTYMLLSTSVLLFGPTLLFYVRCLSIDGYRLRWRHLWHLTPWLINLVLFVPIIADPTSQLSANVSPNEQQTPALIPLLKITTLTGYLVVVFGHLVRHSAQLRHHYSNFDGVSLNWIKTLIIGFVAFEVIAIVMLLLNPVVVDTWLSAILVATVFLIGFFGMRQDNAFVTDRAPKTRYGSSNLTDADVAQIGNRVEEIINANEIFADRFLDLKKLANEVGVSTHQLSQYLNEHRGETFYDFVNAGRIENAKASLIETDHTILDIALAVGFNNKTTFNKAFRKFVGMTPSVYRGRER